MNTSHMHMDSPLGRLRLVAVNDALARRCPRARNAHRFIGNLDVPMFDTVIDARSPSEYALDHLPGAINCPVLDDDERRIVGTIYKQQGAFEARRVGGAMVAANLAALEHNFAAIRNASGGVNFAQRRSGRHRVRQRRQRARS